MRDLLSHPRSWAPRAISCRPWSTRSRRTRLPRAQRSADLRASGKPRGCLDFCLDCHQVFPCCGRKPYSALETRARLCLVYGEFAASWHSAQAVCAQGSASRADSRLAAMVKPNLPNSAVDHVRRWFQVPSRWCQERLSQPGTLGGRNFSCEPFPRWHD